jgi:amino acid adenylation domain-containing protein
MPEPLRGKAPPAPPPNPVPALEGEWRRHLLMKWNDTTVSYPRETCLHELFRQRAEETPDAVAAVSEGITLSYRELDYRSNAIAHILRANGVGPEVIVGLCAGRSLEMVAALLGILKAGGAYLPLDPTYPKDRLAYMLDDTSTSLVLTDRIAASALSGMGPPILQLEDCEPTAGVSDNRPEGSVTSHNLAYVIYTSGSTGKPKGVGATHYNVSRLVTNTNYVTIDRNDVFLQLAPLSFDAATFEIWGALINGAKLVLYPSGLVDLARLRCVIAEEGVSILWLTAGLFNRVVDEMCSALSPVKQLLAGGEALSVPHVKKALAELPSCQIINGYGPTECTTFSVCGRLTRDENLDNGVPIGRPISNGQAYVLDRTLAPVAVGETGELYIGGDGLARGYFNRAGATAERFIANPFGPSGTRLYRTGDLARHQASGELEYLGRLDRQMKIRGYRIEPGEVEAALLCHPGLRQAAVTALADALGDKRLVAYIVGDSGAVPEQRELRGFLKSTLPHYMVPSAFVVLDDLPLTANGKLDREALPKPEWRARRKADGLAARTPIEKGIAAIWSQTLGTADFGITDNFFGSGGTRQTFADVITAIKKRFGVTVHTPVSEDDATIAFLTNAVRARLRHRTERED